jgi:hypothetical protein
MEKTNQLSEMNEVFNNQTLRYRINGFAKACNMIDLDYSSRKRISDRVISKIRYLKQDKDEKGKIVLVPCTKEEEKNNSIKKVVDTVYYIVINKSDQNEFGNGITISGYYKDLTFSFSNYFSDNEDLDKYIKELPFSINLYKKINDQSFRLEIKTINGSETLFTLSKSEDYKTHIANEKISFYKNVVDFSEVLKVIKSFVYNPEFIFINSSEVIKTRKVVFTDEELDRSLMQDKELDKGVAKGRRR